jgi:hypothetical protein
MPRLACRSCGRQIYATAPLESLFGEERRCSRCGATLNQDRREGDRRVAARRLNPSDEPGPPAPVERRVAARRQGPRRKDPTRTLSAAGNRAGWID